MKLDGYDPVGATIWIPLTGARMIVPVPGVAINVKDAPTRFRKITVFPAPPGGARTKPAKVVGYGPVCKTVNIVATKFTI